MAQTYTLEEAADKLGVTTEEMKRRLKEDWKTLRSFRDGSTLRFRAGDIDELARSLGAASDPELPLASMEDEPPGSDDYKVGPTPTPKPADEPLLFGSSDEDIFSLSAEDPKHKVKPPLKKEGDSDVRLEVEKTPKSSKAKPSKGKKDDADVVPTEEIALDLSGPGSAVIKGGSSAKLSAPKSSTKLSAGSDSGKHLANPGAGDSSEFELSLDADSSDFELQLNTDSSDEVDLGSMPKEKSGKPRAGESGINLARPADSGINLENKKKGDSGKSLAKKKPPVVEEDSDDFELSLEPAGKSGPKNGGPKSKPPVTSDSDSEFELTLDDSGEGSSLEAAALESADGDKNDIFETDFEIPSMADESGSEAVALESDTDLEAEGAEVELAMNESDMVAEEETGSQVVLLEDDGLSSDVDLSDVEVEDETESVSAAMKRVKPKVDDDEDELAPAAAGAPAKWGALPAIVLAFAFIPIFFGALMGYELLHTMWGYQQPRKPAAPVVRWAATQLDMDVKDQ